MDERTLKDARILIVDDEVANVRLMERLLARAGYATLRARPTRARCSPFAPSSSPT